MIWANARDVILNARSSYYNMFIICRFPTIFLFYNFLWSLIQNLMRERLQIRYVSLRHVIMFSVAGFMLKIYFT